MGQPTPTAGPSVSVVVTAVRVDDWLRQSVASALTQEGAACEVIVVLDGCTGLDTADFSGQIRVVPLVARRGAAAARNVGGRESDGQLIAVLDGDDLADEDRVARQVRELHETPGISLVANSLRKIDAFGAVVGEYTVRDRDPASMRRALVLRNRMFHSGMLLVRRDLEAVGGYAEELDRFIDYDLYLRMLLAGYGAAGRSSVVGSYRVHASNMGRGPVPSAVLDRIVALRSELARTTGQPRLLSAFGNAAWRFRNGPMRRRQPT